ncbi:MAG TPA: DUF4198 domain-containing protein [Nitrospira sp.]|nr:DUF4198 domain-containing protein [Nitrospira sp.]
MKGLTCFVCLTIMVSAHTETFGHDVWITTKPDTSGSVQALVHHGHPGDRKTPDLDKLFDLTAYDAGGQAGSLLPGVVSGAHEGVPVLITKSFSETGIVVLAARYDNGYWVNTPYGHRNTSRLQIPDGADSLSSMKYAKTLLPIRSAASNPYRTIVGHRLELVPLDDPFTLKPGASLSVRVYFEGKPLRGASVEWGDGVTPMEEQDIPRFKTDEQGIAVIPLAKTGPQLLVVDHFVPAAHHKLAARDLHNATLSFVLPSP